MSFDKIAQEVKEIVIDDEPIEISEELDSGDMVEVPISLSENDFETPSVEINVNFNSELPGVPQDQVQLIKMEPKELVVSDDDDQSNEIHDQAKDDNDAKTKKKKSEKWDWESKGSTGFIEWINERFQTVPKHSGKDTAGLERAISYLERLDSEISRAMKLDVDEELDADSVEKVRNKIEEGVSKLEERLDEIKKTKKNKKKKAEDENPFVKVATTPTLKGNYVQVPLLISGLARMCVNSVVSAGHSLEDTFEKLSKKFNLNDRERFELLWLLTDMGYPIRADRFNLDEKDFDSSKSGVDFAANYPA